MRAASRLLPVFLIVGCHDCGSSQPPVVLPPPATAPVVSAVEIVPRTVFAAPGTTFRLPAWIKGTGGSSLRMAAFPDLEITWWASADVLVDPSANPVQIVSPTTRGAEVDVKVTVTRIRMEGGVRIVLQTIESPMAKIVVAPNRTSTDDSDWIFVDHSPGEFPRALVLEGLDGADPVSDWVLGTVGIARLGRNLRPSPSGELALFGVGREMALWPPAEPAPWTAAPDDVDAMGAVALASGFRELPVRFGLDLDTTNVSAWAQDQVTYAFRLLGDTRLGIGRYWLGTFQHNRHDAMGVPLPVADPTAACSTASVNLDIAPFSITDPTDPALYVLIVPSIGSAVRGWACTPQTGWTGRVVFVSWAEYSLSTIAHEIGHVLALRYPDIETGFGHTNGVPGFDWSNLMWSFSAEYYRSKRDHLSIGQIYRMNADPQSWLNELLPSSLLMTRDCQIIKATGACPALTTDLER